MDEGDSSLGIALTLLFHCSAISMMAIGGGVMALTPELERLMVITHHWMSSRAFIEDFTLAQAAPGPNMLFVTLVGLQAAGFLGAVGATLGIIGPPSGFLLLVLRYGRSWVSQSVGVVFRRALAPLSVGLMLATGLSLSRMAVDSWQGVLLLAVTVLVILRSQLNPLWLIALGGIAGAAGWV